MKRLVVILAILIAAPASADAGDCTPNLQADVASPLRTIRRPFDHRARGRLAVRVRNESDCAVAGKIGVKPLMLPAPEQISHGDHSHPSGDGRVLPTGWVDLDVGSDAGQVVFLDGRLPALDWTTWRLTVIVDSSHTIGETNELDNVPDLVDAGYRGVARGNPEELGVDLTSRIRGRLAKQTGGVAHTLGLSARPNVTDPIESHDVGARFLLADVESGKVYTLVYADAKPCKPGCDEGLTCDVGQGICVDDAGNPVPEIDKEYYALAWGADLDELGRPVVTDIYWQAPRFVDPGGAPQVPPGDYRFLTVMDSWDRVDEFDESDNVDAVPFTLAPLEVIGFPNTWFVSTPIEPSPPAVSAGILNSYSSSLSYTVEVPASVTWLSVTPAGGTLGIDESDVLHLSVVRGALTPGEYHADVSIVAAGLEEFPVVLPVVFYVYGDEVPAIEVSPTTLDFQTTIGVHPPGQPFTLSNPGTLPLDWEAWPSVEWISVSPPSGTGPAGYQEDVQVIIHPEGLPPGGPYTGRVDLFSSAPDGGRSVTARLVVGPCEQGWCDEGWTCNFDTHFCEPPQACATHDECPSGQHCPPALGYCEQSGSCTGPDDCFWSEWGVMTCDTDRSTCELATCAADDDCPEASYCNESAGTCPFSGSCDNDDDCFGSGAFAFACDQARASCEPAVCSADPDCPAASYCSEFWGQCVETQHCTSDQQCYPMGLQCDEARDACVP